MQLQGKYLLASSAVIAVLVAPFAVAAGEGDPLLGGTRNPSPDRSEALGRETAFIANTSTYGTRQSNKSDNGGGAIYGCRSAAGGTRAGNEPCVRANNLSAGRAFEFETNGTTAGVINARGGAAARPFTTNATGVATGLNADRVDNLDASQIVDQARSHNRIAAVRANGTIIDERGVASAQRTSEGIYGVTFDEPVTRCGVTATQIAGDDGGAAVVEALDDKTLRVRTRAGAGDNPLSDRQFHLIAIC